MHARPWHLRNSPEIEAWPAPLVKARANADARALAGADWCLRRKRDGRFLAAVGPRGLHALQPGLAREPGLGDALAALETRDERAGDAARLPLAGLLDRLDRLGLDADDYHERTGLPLIAEPARLEFAGRDRFRRPLWLLAPAARAWLRMRAAAARDDVALDAISGWRSHDYQLGIFARKLARGQTVAQILGVNAAPGYSEHHAGTALDIGTPGDPPAEESFEATPAFAWLRRHAGDFGFALSYPRDNPHGIIYEPWHWRWWPGG
jgi:D-alanyl-D-alanine carboxypeptidase